MAQPSLSEQIRRLEAELGVPLFVRAGRGAELDPTRRRLRALAQRAGVVLEPVIEVEYLTAALDLAARGLGDTIGPRSVLEVRGYGRRLGVASLDPPLYETFAFITRRA